MRAVMYHYVRPAPSDLPHFRYLHVESFERQLDWLAQHHRFVGREELFAAVAAGRAPEGVVLTFDDGFSDHLRYVLPALVRRGLWGMFFIPTAILDAERLLDVHRIHWLLGRLGGVEALARLRPLLSPELLPDRDVAAFRNETYRSQTNDEATTLFKRCMNYFVAYAHREALLDRLMAEQLVDERALCRDLYLSREDLAALRDAGMEMGSHGHEHLVFSKLDPARQRTEIERSFDLLRRATGAPVRSFCYPYGGRHTYTDVTQRLLTEAGARLSFDVDPRDATHDDVARRPQALPRYDCNQLEHGQASYGGTELPADGVEPRTGQGSRGAGAEKAEGGARSPRGA
jgi:peptidoglycan/xylan/chitin deacetylase (PgdA/CDA1 family)